MALRRRGRQAREHPDRRVRALHPGTAPRREPFEQLVERALDQLPEEFQRLLEDVAIVIEDRESPEQRRAGRVHRHSHLYGLYQGTPATQYGSDWSPFPNKITLFRLALEADFSDPGALARQVRQTVVHELGHHAGIDEERLRALGVG